MRISLYFMGKSVSSQLLFQNCTISLSQVFIQPLNPPHLLSFPSVCAKKKSCSVGGSLIFHFVAFQTSSWPLVQCDWSGNFHLDTNRLQAARGSLLPRQHKRRFAAAVKEDLCCSTHTAATGNSSSVKNMKTMTLLHCEMFSCSNLKKKSFLTALK